MKFLGRPRTPPNRITDCSQAGVESSRWITLFKHLSHVRIKQWSFATLSTNLWLPGCSPCFLALSEHNPNPLTTAHAESLADFYERIWLRITSSLIANPESH